MNEKINALMEDEGFVESILQLETAEEVQKAFADKGVDLTVQDIEAIKDAVIAKTEGELSEDDLENVAGGADVGGIITVVVDGILKLGDKIHEWTRRRW